MGKSLKRASVSDVEIQEISRADDEATMKVKLGLIDYGSGKRNFEVRMYLPESMKSLVNRDFVDFMDSYNTYGHSREIYIDKEINIQPAEGAKIEDIIDSHWDWETVYFDLYNDKSFSNLIYHGV